MNKTKQSREQLQAKKEYHESKVSFYDKKLEELKPEPIGFKYQGRK